MSLTDALLDRGSPRPLITFYDDATGERIELSGVTTANWAAKTANLLRDECDLEPGGRVAVLLPAHWQTAAALLAVWWCGGEVVAEPDGADLVLTDADRLDLALSVVPPHAVVALSLHAFGTGLTGLPDGVVDFATEVRLHGDEFVPWAPVPGDAPALAGEPVDAVVADARARAVALGLSAGDRVLSTRGWNDPDGLRDGLLAVLAAGASLVQCRHAEGVDLDRRAATEKATHRL